MRTLIVGLSMLLIGCSSTDSEPPENVWRVASSTTATWTGEQITATGTMIDSFDPENTDVELTGHPDKGWIVITVEFNKTYGGHVYIEDTLSMYSRPLSTDVLDLDRRDMPTGDGSTDLELAGIVMNGDVNCEASPSGIEEFEIIYEDPKETYIRTTFESYGMEETIKEITCN